jgi:hypothetical protein
MTDPSSTSGYGGPRYRGAGQSLAEQPTTVVPFHDHAHEEPHPVPGFLERDDRAAYLSYDDRTGYDDDLDHLPDDLHDGWDPDGADGSDPDDVGDDEPAGTRRDHSSAPVAVRRADTVAGLLLLLAGMAAGVSLLLVWVDGGATGLDLVRGGLEDAQDGAATLAGAGSWQPLAVVGGGIVLFVLGLLMYAPARTHRFLGVLALLVAIVVAAGVLVPLADASWDLDRSAVGAWFTAAVAGLGLLGALKAMSTGPRTSG